MLKKLGNILLFMCLPFAMRAQEFNCMVKVMADAVQGQGQDKEVFRSMQQAVTEFMNSRKWTEDQYSTSERINCNILINVTQALPGVQNGFMATISIQAARPVYNANYMSQIVKHVDKDVQFSYNQFAPLEFNDNRVAGNNVYVSNLPAVLAYYAYIMLGFDYDSYSSKGGEPFFKKAQNIVNNAPEQGKVITGWKAVEGNHNRYWLVDQILSPRFQAMRALWYSIHREALDNMYKSPQEGQKIILNSLNTLAQVQKENPGTIYMQFFFNAKSDEFASVVAQQPVDKRAPYITTLSTIDVPNVQKYNSLKN